MKSKHLFIGILTVLFVFPLMGAFAQQEPAATTIQPYLQYFRTPR